MYNPCLVQYEHKVRSFKAAISDGDEVASDTVLMQISSDDAESANMAVLIAVKDMSV